MLSVGGSSGINPAMYPTVYLGDKPSGGNKPPIRSWHTVKSVPGLAKLRRKRVPANYWAYPASSGVLTECGLQTIKEYVRRRRQSIAACVVDRPLFVACREGERRRGSPHYQWWWEQEMELDLAPPTGADASGDETSLGSLSSVGGSENFSG